MKQLVKGAIDFHEGYYKEHKERYDKLANQQNPHTLFIGCCDSRVLPQALTASHAGDLFVMRNIANIVPKFEDRHHHYAVSSSIEYAVKVLQVENIIVCGHANCGGCKAMVTPTDQLSEVPLTKEWIIDESLAYEEEENKLLKTTDPKQVKEILKSVEQKNVLKQLDNLRTYPMIKERLDKDKLNIIGWYYNIEEGMIYQFDEATRAFGTLKPI